MGQLEAGISSRATGNSNRNQTEGAQVAQHRSGMLGGVVLAA